MLDKEGIRYYVKIYNEILKNHKIFVAEKDLVNIYKLIVLTFELDDLYDSTKQLPSETGLNKIKKEMISLMPNNHPIALYSIELVFKAMEEEAQCDLSESLTRYLSICGKSIGAQLVAGYLASRSCIAQDIWLSKPITKFNDEINNLIRLANDYLDVTVDIQRMSKEVPQIKAIHFFRSKFALKIYICQRFIFHKARYYLYQLAFRCFNFSSHRRGYLTAIDCSESVLDLAVKAYITDKKSGREPDP